MSGRAPVILRKACVCGHAEDMHQHDHPCSECGQHVDGDGHCEMGNCRCEEFNARCQNCGEPAYGGGARIPGCKYDVCSRRCVLQLEYADALLERAAP